jgi:hypothetical protein
MVNQFTTKELRICNAERTVSLTNIVRHNRKQKKKERTREKETCPSHPFTQFLSIFDDFIQSF